MELVTLLAALVAALAAIFSAGLSYLVNIRAQDSESTRFNAQQRIAHAERTVDLLSEVLAHEKNRYKYGKRRTPEEDKHFENIESKLIFYLTDDQWEKYEECSGRMISLISREVNNLDADDEDDFYEQTGEIEDIGRLLIAEAYGYSDTEEDSK